MTATRWLRISLFNLCLVALLGVLMRYKIGFEFPYLEQKNLQHSHSHFAFAGWVSQTLMVLMVQYLTGKFPTLSFKNYTNVLWANLLSAYGMLIAFICQGYGAISIAFSMASILSAVWFGIRFLRDLNATKADPLLSNWFRAAILFNWFSALGTFVLAYMMATKTLVESTYLASIYFYLHFHYNGWFFLVCMGLLYGWLNLSAATRFYRTFFWLTALSVIPAYGLSVLWLDLPWPLFVLTAVAALVQFAAWIKFAFVLWRDKPVGLVSAALVLRRISVFVALALTLKLGLQLASVIPSLSELAFGFRPIVIAYLHLVLLAVISLFILYYIFAARLLPLSRTSRIGLGAFAIGVIANEVVLGIQGIGALSYTALPFGNEMLFAIAVLLFGSMAYLACRVFLGEKKQAI